MDIQLLTELKGTTINIALIDVKGLNIQFSIIYKTPVKFHLMIILMLHLHNTNCSQHVQRLY